MLYGDERRKTHPGTILYNGVVPAFSPGPGFLSNLSKKNSVLTGQMSIVIIWNIVVGININYDFLGFFLPTNLLILTLFHPSPSFTADDQ